MTKKITFTYTKRDGSQFECYVSAKITSDTALHVKNYTNLRVKIPKDVVLTAKECENVSRQAFLKIREG